MIARLRTVINTTKNKMKLAAAVATSAATAVLLASLSFPAAAQSQSPQGDAALSRARALIEAKDARGALDLLSPLEAQRAGQPEFDYLLGMALLDAGDAQAAVFALERVVAVQPDNLAARTELARAHFTLGENERAKREFQRVRKGRIPADAAASIDRFLSAIERGPTQLYRYAEATAGFDSNVNSATGSGTLAIPGLGTVVLGPGLTRDGDSFMGLGAGFSVVHPLRPGLAVIGGASVATKLNGEASTFDTANLDGNAGLRWTQGKNVYSASLLGQSFRVDNTRYRDSVGVTGQWQHNYSETRQATLFLQYSDLSYPAQQVRDAERWIVGGGYAAALGMRYKPIVFASAYTGSERENSAGVPHLGHTPFGLRVGGQLSLTGDWTLFGSLSWEERRYGGPEPLFGATRKDTQSDLRVGANWRVAPQWLVTPQLSYTDNDSNVALYAYSRTLASVTVRYEF